MINERLFIGNIMKCTKYKSIPHFQNKISINNKFVVGDSFGHIETEQELYKEKSILIKTNNGGYIDLSNSTILDELYIPLTSKNKGFLSNGRIMATHAFCENQLYVDESSLQPYSTKRKENTPILKLKKANKLEV